MAAQGVCLTLKAFENALSIRQGSVAVIPDRKEFIRVATRGVRELQELVKDSYKNCVLALKQSDPSITGYRQPLQSAIIMLPDVEVVLLKRLLSVNVKSQNDVLCVVYAGVEAMQKLLVFLGCLIPQQHDFEEYCKSLFQCCGHDQLLVGLFRADGHMAWAQAFEIYIRKAVQLEYKIPKDADGSPQLVLNMKLMIQAGAECALHCHRISASSYADSKCQQKAQSLLKLLPVWRDQINTLIKSVDCDMTRCAQIGAARLFFTFVDHLICEEIGRQAATRIEDNYGHSWPKLLSAICAKFDGLTIQDLEDTLETSSRVELAAQPWSASRQLPAKSIPLPDKKVLAQTADKETLAQQMADQLIAEEVLAKSKQARKLNRAQAARKKPPVLCDPRVVSYTDTDSHSDSDANTYTNTASCEASNASSTELSDEPDWFDFVQLLTCPLSKVGRY